MNATFHNRNIIVVHPGALGDLICSFPVICRLIEEGSRVDLLAESRLGRLAADLLPIRRYFPLESALFSSLYSERTDSRMASMLREYDAVICFSASVILGRSFRTITDARVIQLPPKPPVNSRIHVTDYFFREIFTDSTSFLPKIAVKKMGPKASGSSGPIIFHPGSGSRRKNWPLPNFIAASSLLAQKGFQTQWILGPAEVRMSEKIRAHGLNCFVIDDLLVLTEELSQAAGYMGNDSGVSHLAAFLGVPTVAIFGPSDPRRWAPKGRASTVIRGETNCQPCFETLSENCCNADCLASISIKKAVDLLLGLDEFKSFL